MKIEKTCIDYKKFIKKYNFTHMVVYKKTCLYYYLKNDNTKIVFDDKKYVIFEL